MSHSEKRSIPAVAWTAATFVHDAEWSGNVWGRPELALAVVPECFTNNSPDVIRSMVDAAMDQVIKGLTRMPEQKGVRLEPIPRRPPDPELHFQGSDGEDCFARMQRAFVQAHWSDGFPLVPPTRRKVDAMVAFTGLPADHVLGYL